jgi:trehalose 6-phosphate phosphatase
VVKGRSPDFLGFLKTCVIFVVNSPLEYTKLMQPPIPSIDNVAVFLDFDGTLVDFAKTPEAVFVPSELKSLLQELNGSVDGALALVTGRSLESLDALLEEKALCAAGCHGAEWRAQHAPSGTVERGSAALDEARGALAPFVNHHELILENKPYSLALHFRRSPHLEAEIDQWLDDNLAHYADLRMIKGKFVREIQIAGVDKGVAVERFMQHSPFAGRVPIYIGDDVTDEDAFAWVNQHGGISVKVGEGESIATYHLPDHTSVAAWLAKLVAD